MSAIIIKDHIVHYEVLGRGRPVLFLHGWVGSWRYWVPAMQSASQRYRAYALDLWGFGDSDKHAEHYALASQIHLLAAFLEEMGIGKVALIGHGLGAVVGLFFALQYPLAVDRMAMVAMPSTVEAIHPRLQSDPPERLASWLLTPTLSTETARKEAPKTDPAAITTSLAEIQAMDLLAEVMRVEAPCLLVHGRNDPLISLPAEDTLTRLPENMHQIIFEKSGHFPMLDEPSKFNRLMYDFLLLESGVSPRQLQLKEEWKRRVR